MSEVEDYVGFYNWRTAVQDLLLPDERRHTAAVRAAGRHRSRAGEAC